ncbi:hypothetical protein GGF39_002143 [Coemansia sp. RSA 1721]|nr:hypothetical protein GGF39_002143 [Coemansia sp. RSA 1721]
MRSRAQAGTWCAIAKDWGAGRLHSHGIARHGVTWLASAPAAPLARPRRRRRRRRCPTAHAITAAAATASGDWPLRGAVGAEREGRRPAPAYCEDVTRAARERATAKRRPSPTSQGIEARCQQGLGHGFPAPKPLCCRQGGMQKKLIDLCTLRCRMGPLPPAYVLPTRRTTRASMQRHRWSRHVLRPAHAALA